MSKGVGTRTYTFKILGYKVSEFAVNWIWRQTEADDEEIRDDITLHENIIKNMNKKDDSGE